MVVADVGLFLLAILGEAWSPPASSALEDALPAPEEEDGAPPAPDAVAEVATSSEDFFTESRLLLRLGECFKAGKLKDRKLKTE